MQNRGTNDQNQYPHKWNKCKTNDQNQYPHKTQNRGTKDQIPQSISYKSNLEEETREIVPHISIDEAVRESE